MMDYNTKQTHPKAYLASAFVEYLRWYWSEKAVQVLGRKSLAMIEKPEICFVDGQRFLGRWSWLPERKTSTIELNYSLLDGSAAALLAVFEHEVAHQLTHFLHPLATQPHGKEFREICRKMGAPAEACVDIVSLDERIQGAGGESTVVGRLKKLLALAERGDENEAQVALAKAAELMAKYGLTENDAQDENGQFITVELGKPFARNDYVQSYMTCILETYWNVRIIKCKMPSENGEWLFHRLMSGTQSKVQIALYVHDYILNQIDESFAKSPIFPKNRTTHFKFAAGFLQGLEDKLKKVNIDEKTKALILVGDAALERYYHARNPRMTISHCHLGNGNREAYDNGREAGGKMEMRPGVKDVSGRYLLGK